MTVLFVGDTTFELFSAAQRYNPFTKLITSENISDLPNISTGHISLGDVTIDEFKYALDLADELYYVPFNSANQSLKRKTLIWLRYQSHRKPVHNLPKISTSPMLDLIDLRKTEKAQLWVAGCSFTYGVGVSQHERWGDVLASLLDLPVSTLAQPGSSIRWAADQILRSDIRKDDIVVWGVTGASRFPYYHTKIDHICLNYYQKNPRFNSLINQKVIVSDHVLYESLISIDQVIHYCSILGCKLVLMYFYLDIEGHQDYILEHLSKFDIYIDFSKPTPIDYGTDGEHPGPKQQEMYARTIYKFLTS